MKGHHTMTERETAWLQFKAEQDDPELPPCPFCGIRHKWSKAHPYCSMVSQFENWHAAQAK
jgi:hypothetical protein